MAQIQVVFLLFLIGGRVFSRDGYFYFGAELNLFRALVACKSGSGMGDQISFGEA